MGASLIVRMQVLYFGGKFYIVHGFALTPSTLVYSSWLSHHCLIAPHWCCGLVYESYGRPQGAQGSQGPRAQAPPHPPPPSPWWGPLGPTWVLLAAWDTLGMALKLLLAPVRQREAFQALLALRPWTGKWRTLWPQAEKLCTLWPEAKKCRNL